MGKKAVCSLTPSDSNKTNIASPHINDADYTYKLLHCMGAQLAYTIIPITKILFKNEEIHYYAVRNIPTKYHLNKDNVIVF